MRYRGLLTIIFCLIICLHHNIEAGTNIDIVLDGYTFTDEAEAEEDFVRFPNLFFSNNNKVIPTAFAMVNTIGYPNGKSSINPYPDFEFGFAVGGGVLEYNRISEYSNENPTVPFGGFNGGFHIGTGITDRIDITFKFFYFSLEWISILNQSFEGEDTTSYYKIDIQGSDITSFGLKMRYNLIKRRMIVPMLFSFGGASFNIGFDYMNGKLNSEISFVDIQYTNLASEPNPINIESTINGTGTMDWDIFSTTTEAFVYIDIISFSLYTGPSVSFNFGSLDFDVNGSGNFDAYSPTVSGNIGNIFLTSRNHMEPSLIIPKWTFGIEFNIVALKLQLEVSGVLTSINDSFTAQMGARLQM